jgi:hypothetical protein
MLRDPFADPADDGVPDAEVISRLLRVHGDPVDDKLVIGLKGG